MTRVLNVATAIIVLATGATDAGSFELQLPIACEVGKDCFIQYYVDSDPGPGVRDYACNAQSYDGHKGTDIRVRTLDDVATGFDVLAAAGGIVKGRRDGVADHLVKTKSDIALNKNRECGNGVLIDHGKGWQTQYCHLRRGSVKVRKGDRVAAGDVLGKVGYSGEAGFPHLHLSVRKDGKIIDPFKGTDAGGAACGPGKTPLWAAPVMQKLEYRAGVVMDAGFAPGKISLEQVETGAMREFIPMPESAALIAWGWAINLQKDDQIFAVLAGPDGRLAENKVTLDTGKAQYMLFAGKKRTGDRWPPGRYVAFFGVVRDGKPVLRAARPFVMQ